jgi:hypothetical protein
MSAAVGVALQVQELLDIVAEFLADRPGDLKSWALVRSTFTSSAQRQLFQDIFFHHDSADFDEFPNLTWYSEEATTCQRFCAVLNDSPHLTGLVRRMRLSIDPSVLRPLTKFQFPNLRVVLFQQRPGGGPYGDSPDMASRLIRASSIRRVGLLFILFPNIRAMAHIFQSCASTLDSVLLHHVSISDIHETTASVPPSRTKIRTLRWEEPRLHALDASWLIHPLCPFDLSELDGFEGRNLAPAILKVLDHARMSIRRLSMNARSL